MVLVAVTVAGVAGAAAVEEKSVTVKRRGDKRKAREADAVEGKKGARRGAARDPNAAAALAAQEQAKAANRGVLNGPLTAGGHRAAGEGNRQSLKLAIEDLIATYGDKYPQGKEFLKRLEAIPSDRSAEFEALKKDALLANPLLDFDHLLMVRSRKGKRFAANWQTQVSCGAAGDYDDELVVMSPICDGEVKVVYQPGGGKFVGDVDLHFDADRVLFTSHRDMNTLSAGAGQRQGLCRLRVEDRSRHGAETRRAARGLARHGPRRRLLRRLLPAGRTDHLRLHRQLRGRPVRGRQVLRREPLPHERRRDGSPQDHLRPGRQLASEP